MRGPAPPGSIPDDLKNINIKNRYIPVNAESIGTISSMEGHVVVLHRDTNQAYYASEGNKIYKQDIFFTLISSSCRIRFTTRDLLTMGENTKIAMDEYIDDIGSRSKKSTINLIRGKALFYIVKLFKYRNSSTNIKTVTAVVGVRGTKIGVQQGKIDPVLKNIPQPKNPLEDVTTLHTFQGSAELCNADGQNCHVVDAGQSGWVDSDGNMWVGHSPDGLKEDMGLFGFGKGGKPTGDNLPGTGNKDTYDPSDIPDDVDTDADIDKDHEPGHSRPSDQTGRTQQNPPTHQP